MAELRVEPEPLLALADHISMASSDLARDTVEIQYLLSELDNKVSVRWVGDADEKITQTIDAAKDGIDYCKQLGNTLDEISSALRKIYETYLRTEETTVAQINASLRDMA